jgi:endoglucanase
MDNPGTDAAASAASAFAAASLLYSGNGSSINSRWTSTTLRNATYAATLLTHAEQLYAYARTAEQKLYSESVPEASSYPSNSYEDDLVLAAIWLYRATANQTYLSDAISIYNSSELAGSNAVFNWASKTPALPILLAQSTEGNAREPYIQETERYFNVIVNAPRKSNSKNAPFFTGDGLLVGPA